MAGWPRVGAGPTGRGRKFGYFKPAGREYGRGRLAVAGFWS